MTKDDCSVLLFVEDAPVLKVSKNKYQGRIQESKKGWAGKLRPERKPSRLYANTIC
jgi:hypothetical protein